MVGTYKNPILGLAHRVLLTDSSQQSWCDIVVITATNGIDFLSAHALAAKWLVAMSASKLKSVMWFKTFNVLSQFCVMQAPIVAV